MLGREGGPDHSQAAADMKYVEDDLKKQTGDIKPDTKESRHAQAAADMKAVTDDFERSNPAKPLTKEDREAQARADMQYVEDDLKKQTGEIKLTGDERGKILTEMDQEEKHRKDQQKG